MLKVLQIGAKNFPPSHGGTERVVYNIVQSITNVDFYLLVEWEQQETEKIKVLPNKLNYFQRMVFIYHYAKNNSMDIIHFHNEKYIPMAILLSVFFRRIVLTVHGVHFRSPRYNLFIKSGFWFVDMLGSIFLPRMVHCTECDQKEFSKYIFFRKTYYINNGTTICDKAQTLDDIIFPDTYVYLGRITPAKNLLNVVSAAERRKIKVHIFGKFDEERPDYCKSFIAAVDKAKYVSYKGEVPFDKVFSTMKKYKAFLYITIMEGLPLSVLEAASCGMSLLLSDIPQHKYLNLPDVNYLDVNDPNIPYPEKIVPGLENRAYIMKNFSVEKMGEEYYKIYTSFK